MSLRNIVEAAKVNPTIALYFGSKQALLHAVVSRRLRPVNEERLSMLAEARAKAGKRKLKREAVLESLFAPVFVRRRTTSPATRLHPDWPRGI